MREETRPDKPPVAEGEVVPDAIDDDPLEAGPETALCW
jgi:hypothetical protein